MLVVSFTIKMVLSVVCGGCGFSLSRGRSSCVRCGETKHSRCFVCGVSCTGHKCQSCFNRKGTKGSRFFRGVVVG